MRLYAGSSVQFLEDTIQNQIADKLKNAFFDYYRYNPSPAEVNSWRNSLRAISQIFQYSNLMDHGVILEYQLPLSSKRLDCIICGRSASGIENATIIELKQWEKSDRTEADNLVLTWVGGSKREVLHPAVQVRGYRLYLQDTHTAFNVGSQPVALTACTYLHNYSFVENDPLLDDKFRDIFNEQPIFSADDVDSFKQYLQEHLQGGHGGEVLRKIEQSKYRPSKKLMEHVANIIQGKPEYVLLDEQQVVYDVVFSCARKSFHEKKKVVIIVKGGPGTGKSVIAINLMSNLLNQGYNAHYATGSRAFTETLRNNIGQRGSVQFKYFNSYIEAEANSIDVLICDEAHRLRLNSYDRFTPLSKRSKGHQIEELIKAGKVVVFFIDDNQIVRPNEVGSVAYIREFATKHGCKLYEYELEAQFRCNGSDAFVNWVNNTLQIRRTANVIWDQHEEFDFQILDSPEAIEAAIRSKIANGSTGRMVAGFCWPWSNPNPDGTLKNDVTIDSYMRPWNAKPEARHLAAGIPKATLWANEAGGINQIGCIYTAQGFEFDYVGVIIGKDLRYDFDMQMWIGDREQSFDPGVKRSKEKYLELVKNVYRVLLTRGMKGCFVHFMDKDTERFFKSRIESLKGKKEILPARSFASIPIEKSSADIITSKGKNHYPDTRSK